MLNEICLRILEETHFASWKNYISNLLTAKECHPSKWTTCLLKGVNSMLPCKSSTFTNMGRCPFWATTMTFVEAPQRDFQFIIPVGGISTSALFWGWTEHKNLEGPIHTWARMLPLLVTVCNSHHQNDNILRLRNFFETFICHCCWVGE